MGRIAGRLVQHPRTTLVVGVLEAAAVYDITQTANDDLKIVVPVAIVAIGLLLALVRRSAVAQLYLIVSVALSSLASLGIPTMDTFLVRTLLVPSTVIPLGRRNWWPSSLSRSDEMKYLGGPPWPPNASSSSPETASAPR